MLPLPPPPPSPGSIPRTPEGKAPIGGREIKEPKREEPKKLIFKVIGTAGVTAEEDAAGQLNYLAYKLGKKEMEVFKEYALQHPKEGAPINTDKGNCILFPDPKRGKNHFILKKGERELGEPLGR